MLFRMDPVEKCMQHSWNAPTNFWIKHGPTDRDFEDRSKTEEKKFKVNLIWYGGILPFELVMSQIRIYGCMNTVKNRLELGIGVETDAPHIYTLRICEM